MENYIKLTCEFISDNPDLASDIIIGELSEFKFETFEKIDNKINAYIKESDFSESIELKLAEIYYPVFSNLKFLKEIIPQKNWNKIWESNFEPLYINENCIIKAPFHHNTPKVTHEIIIEPKMSFGTGHHATTFLMINELLKLDLTNKSVLDVGCGTGILSILASKLNAKFVYGIDIDDWSFQNAKENCTLNNITNVTIQKGEIDIVRYQLFDIILANINLNVIIHSLQKYAEGLHSEGWLLLSGFYNNDIKTIIDKAIQFNLHLFSQAYKNDWSVCVLIKS